MLSRVTINIIKRSVCSNVRTFYGTRGFLKLDPGMCNDGIKLHNVHNLYNPYIVKRFKSKKKTKNKEARDEKYEENEEKDEEEIPLGSKLLKIKVTSIRLDSLSKVAFGMSRSKIEEAFYASKLRINGNKILKKSKEVAVGDEVDLILHQSKDNPGFLIVHRFVVLSLEPIIDDIKVKLSIDKNLLIENYKDYQI
ncbi:hypothetical protein P5V15_001905 [Pogonomyrmex californicus]